MTSPDSEHTLTTDVLVVGGGPAGTWAAIKAAQAGAEVVLTDKGYTGASGATAAVGTGIWFVDDFPERREAAMAGREGLGGLPRRPGLDDARPRRGLYPHGRTRPGTALPVPRRRPWAPDPQ
ncbi:FAD-dependent oxidoreductase [Streptomyces doebereineriae]|uniref:FAD-dependent oxidoreductase n=1 Tax=Streptomyces doebereineriae TaxID=3075528 RepID=A0ABU2VEU2_9ACTN|nr:FAD-dependent oxidoreductase [Streptomyces sp. DSM 41640]MDT0483929.1 FAD-dependent oxidoreductase [Streptomyces sp. DSM 41640]